MSTFCVNYILYEIQQTLGFEIESLCRFLLNNDYCNLKEIVKEFPHMKKKKIEKYLKLLIDYNFVIFTVTDNFIDSYEFDIEGFLAFNRSSRFLGIIEKIYGIIPRLICLNLYSFGNLSATELLSHTMKDPNSQMNWPVIICDAINNMVKIDILQITPMFSFENFDKISDVYINVEKVTDYFANETRAISGQKRHNKDDENLWNKRYRINPECVNRLCKNDIISKDVRDSLGEDAAFIMDVLLQYLHDTNPISYDDQISVNLLLKKVEDTGADIDKDVFEDCIYLLSKSDPSLAYIQEREDSISTLVVFDDKKVTELIVIRQLLESVQVCFGRNGLIVFNYLLRNPYTEEGVFINSVMITTDQLQSLVPAMVNKGYISKLELSKTKLFFDEPLVTLLHVDINRLVRIEQQTCYEILHKLLIRRNHEEKKQFALLTKVYELTMSNDKDVPMDEDEILVVTENDKEALNKMNESIQKLEAAESAIQNTLIMLESHITHQMTSAAW